MRSVTTVMISLLLLFLAGCSNYTESRTVHGVGVPPHCTEIGFNNGAVEDMFVFEDAEVKLAIRKSTSLISITDGNSVQFYNYVVSGKLVKDHGREVEKMATIEIIDSEGLSIWFSQ